jgi:hypothetical protein
MASNCASVRFLVEGQIACTHACVATNGAELNLATSQKRFSLRWETSIMIPRRLHALTKSFPSGVNPGAGIGHRGQANGTPWPNVFGRLQTSPSERSPERYRFSSSARSSMRSTFAGPPAADPQAKCVREDWPAPAHTLSAHVQDGWDRSRVACDPTPYWFEWRTRLTTTRQGSNFKHIGDRTFVLCFPVPSGAACRSCRHPSGTRLGLLV